MMKKTILLNIFIFLFMGMTSAQSEKLTGSWLNEKYKVSYTFQASGSVIFDQGGSSVFISSYSLDESKNPAWLDFTLKRGSQSMVIPALVEFIDENTIKIEQFAPLTNHPVKFSDQEGATIISVHVLKREL